jgi:surfeit locus 1 family protein
MKTGSSPTRRVLPVFVLLVFMGLFLALGTWQVRRLAWKEALIADVDRALHAAPIAPAALPAGDVAPSPITA